MKNWSLNKSLASALVALGSLGALAPQTYAADYADIIVVVDESGSMGGEHTWISGMISSLETSLFGAGVGSGADANRYALVGYGNGLGGANSGRLLAGFGSTATFATGAGSLVTSGSLEDGYAGMNFAFNTLEASFRAGSAVNVILITDEDRDNSNGALTLASINSRLAGYNALLNVVVNNPFSGGAPLVGGALGISSGNLAYFADGSGGFTSSGPASFGDGFGTTETDYVSLALGTGGAAWDLNLLRSGGTTAQSFTAAFVDIKVGEIVRQPPNDGSGAVPEPSTYGLMGAAALLGAVVYRRRFTSKQAAKV
jgi:hypothetical protein